MGTNNSHIDLAHICRVEYERLGNEFELSISTEQYYQIIYTLRGEGHLTVFFLRDDDNTDAEMFVYSRYGDTDTLIPVYTMTENGMKEQFEKEYLDIPVSMRKIVEGYSDRDLRARMGLQICRDENANVIELDTPRRSEPERKNGQKLYRVNQSLMDTYFISVKNRLKSRKLDTLPAFPAAVFGKGACKKDRQLYKPPPF